MGFGLNVIENIPIEGDKTDWVNYNGIMMPKNTARAKKAWDTMRIKQETQSYDRNNKNRIRDEIIKIIKTNLSTKSTILTMETEKFLLVNQLKDYRFFICEKSRKTYLKMCDEYNKNKEVRKSISFLHHGDISEIGLFLYTYDVVYLDFCCTFEKAKGTINLLLGEIFQSKYFGFTFCLRKNKKELDDYKFDMISKIQKLLSSFPYHLDTNEAKLPKRYDDIRIMSNLIYGEAYKDKNHSPMITLFFKNNSHNSNYCREAMRR